MPPRWSALALFALLSVLGAGLLLAAASRTLAVETPLPPPAAAAAWTLAVETPPPPPAAAAPGTAALPPRSYTFRHVATAHLPDGIGENPVAYAAGPGGLLYTANHDSDDVSVLSGTRFLGTVRLPHWTHPRDVAVDSSTGAVYVASELQPVVHVLHGLAYSEAITLSKVPWRLAVDDIRGYLYVTHEDDDVTLLRGTDVITTVHLRDSMSFGERPVAVNPATGLAYVVSRGYEEFTPTDTIFVLQGPAVVGDISLGSDSWVWDNPAVDPRRGYVYVANGRGEVDVLSGTALLAAVPVVGEPLLAVVEPASGLAYAGHQLPGGIAVLSGTAVISDIVTEPCYPQSLAVDPATGDLYTALYCPEQMMETTILVVHGMAVRGELTLRRGMDLASDGRGHVYVFPGLWFHVAVLQRGEVVGRIPGRALPTVVLADPQNGYTYVANGHGSNTVSVLSGTEVITSITTCYGPVGLARLSGPDLIYVGCEDDLAVSILQGTQLLTTTAITTVPDLNNAGPLMATEPQRGWLYFSYRYSPALAVFSGTELLATIPVTGSLGGIVVDPGTDCMLATGLGPGLTVFSGTDVITEIVLSEWDWLTGLLASPNGYVYAKGQITLYIVRENRLVSAMPFTPNGLAVNPVSGYLYYTSWDRWGVISGTQVVREGPEYVGSLYSDTASDRVYGLNSIWPLDASFLMFRGTALVGGSPNGWPWTRSLGAAPGGGYVYLFRGPGPDGDRVLVFREVYLPYRFHLPVVRR